MKLAGQKEKNLAAKSFPSLLPTCMGKRAPHMDRELEGSLAKPAAGGVGDSSDLTMST